LELSALASLALVTLTVNMRFVLMSAAFRPWLGGLPAWQSYPALFFITDANWLAGMRYRGTGGADVSVYLGGGLVMWATWVPSTVIGHQLGSLLSDPRRFGLDLVVPVFFTAILVPMWRGRRLALGWAIGGAVALVTSWLVPGWWFIVTGALAGSIAGGLLDERP
jgi:predicted branched-subunit amino acid permease